TRAIAARSRAAGSLLAAPVWRTDAAGVPGHAEYAEHHVILCEPSGVDAAQLASLLPQCQCVFLHAESQQTIAQRYSEYALACFERIETILRSKPRRKVLVQVVVPGNGEQSLLAGLSGLLKTVALENPQFAGQLIITTPELTADELAECLRKERSRALEPLIRYE